MSGERRYGKPQYIGSEGLRREKPDHINRLSNKLPNYRSNSSTNGFKALSSDAAKQIAEALRSMLH
tara:strand:- start:604 stop:801 length:198 start_codon:yes stop_codon:yes gene_type:complete